MKDNKAKLNLTKLFDLLTNSYPQLKFLGVYVQGKFGIYQNTLKKEINHMALQSFCKTFLACYGENSHEVDLEFRNNGWLLFKKIQEECWLIIGADHEDFKPISSDLDRFNLSKLIDDNLFGSLIKQLKPTKPKSQHSAEPRKLRPQKLDIRKVDPIHEQLVAAKKVQQGLLPDLRKLNQHFEKHFSYYSAENILSGDFYWLQEKGEHVLFAVADCTGHSAEGAMATVMVNALINQNISDNLVETVESIYTELCKYSSVEKGYVIGVELALCNYNRSKGTMEVVSTGVPILYLDKDHSSYLLKPKGKLNMNNVKAHLLHQLLDVNKGERLIIYTDGLPEQFHHTQNEKLGNSGIKKMFESMNGNFSQEAFHDEFMKWKGDNTQSDDITVMAFEI